jgi:glycosyltransferase involved in cell wall biosynthesis
VSEASAPRRPIRVLHVITRMIVGGAQENTMLSCALADRDRFPSELLTGPQTGAEGELHTETRARGVPLRLESSLVREIHPWKDAVALLNLTRLLRSGGWDVVHTHSSKAGILGRLAARLAGVPVVVHTAHGWGFHPRQSAAVRGLYIALERSCARWCDRLIVVGEADREAGLSLGIGRPEQYLLIRSGIEIEAYRDVGISRTEARARAGVPTDAFVVGCVGRLSPQKAPLDLLEAFALVVREVPEAHLLMVGDGPLRGDVEAAIARHGLQGRVHLSGLRRDVPELLRAFDVFALSSHWEGLPRVFPQAMAAGLPIVATRVAGAADAVAEADNGHLVEVGDVSAMAARLVDLARDPARRAAMGRRGLERVEEFSARRMVDQLQALYAELWERRAGARR